MTGVMKLMCIMVVLFSSLAAPCLAAQTVLFDTGHGERFLVGEKGPLQLSDLADTLAGGGLEVATLSQPMSDQTLSGASALVISGPFKPLSSQEMDALIRFMQRGGRVSIMLHIAPPLS